MLFDSLLLPSQAVIPLSVALGHLVIGLYIIFRRSSLIIYLFFRLFLFYLFLTVLWNINLVAIELGDLSFSLFGLTRMELASYSLILGGVIYWSFVRIVLQHSWQSFRPWIVGLIGLIGLALSFSLDKGLIFLPPELISWSSGGINTDNASSILSTACWAMFTGITLLTVLIQLFSAQNPAHRNRILYLLIGTLLIAAGYGMYLTRLEPIWTTGLLITLCGGALAGYVVVVENLVDLSTGVRHGVSRLIVVLLTITVYMVGIYLVQIFLGDFLASTFLTRFLDPVLLVAAVTAVLLTVVYMPLNRTSRKLTNRILFGQNYNYQTVIRNYTQAISNILDLDLLANVALSHIKQVLDIEKGLIFMLASETLGQIHFRILPVSAIEQATNSLVLTKDSPILHRLMGAGQPLAQYTLDISPHFKDSPEAERQALRQLNLEWYVPILKQDQLVGVFALGSKKSRQRYNSRDLRLLTTLADQTALALENASLVDRLQRNLEETTRMKNLMNNVFDSMDNGVITTNLAGKVTLCNRAAESILEIPSADNCIGKDYKQVMPALTQTIFPNLINNVLDREQRYTDYEITSSFPERGQVNLKINLAPLKDAQDKIQGVTIVMDDLTETKRLRAVQDMFRRYVSPAVVDRLPGDPSELELGGQRQETTILFADIRGFTTFSERLDPEALVDILNEYLSIAASAILMFEGTLDKFMGDAVMGIFNAPLKQEDHVLRAVRAAIAMQRSITAYHRDMEQQPSLSFGVGLHVGEAVVGNVGMADRMDYTAIGDTVNLAKRIQENTPGNMILISENVYQVVNGSVQTTFYKELEVKGRQQPVRTYELKWI